MHSIQFTHIGENGKSTSHIIPGDGMKRETLAVLLKARKHIDFLYYDDKEKELARIHVTNAIDAAIKKIQEELAAYH